MRTALLVGATGLIGKQCLYQLLEEKEYAGVIALVRKKLTIKHAKLEQIVVDFDMLENDVDNIKADDIFCCLGTTIKTAGSQEAFKKVDYNYPLHVAEIALKNGANQFLIVTALGANKNSSIFYNKIKGEVEEAICKLAYPSIHIFRPSMLLGHRTEFRLGELIGKIIMKTIGFLFIGPLAKYKAIEGLLVAKAMVKTALINQKGVTIYPSDMIRKIAIK